jgi:Pyruvate/2-oxoacid:ferredoxin oxidoreductase delta subunit
MTASLSRRAFFLGRPRVAPSASPAAVTCGPSPDDAPLETPWQRRERARRERPDDRTDDRLVARITPFACLARAGCSTCSERCPEPAIVIERGRPRVDESQCTGCGACVDACPAPERAIVLLPRLAQRRPA